MTTSDLVLTYLDGDATFDLWSIVSGGEIDIDDWNAFIAPIGSQTPTVVISPPPAAGKWGTAFLYDESTDRVSDYAFAVIHVGGGTVEVGDTVRIGAIGGLINDLRPDGPGGSQAPGQVFDAGTLTNIEIVPEPATAMLLALGGGLAWLVRLKQRMA